MIYISELYLSVCLSVSLSVSLCLSLALSLSNICLCHSFCVSLYMYYIIPIYLYGSMEYQASYWPLRWWDIPVYPAWDIWIFISRLGCMDVLSRAVYIEWNGWQFVYILHRSEEFAYTLLCQTAISYSVLHSLSYTTVCFIYWTVWY